MPNLRDACLYALAFVVLLPMSAQARRHHRTIQKTMLSILCNVGGAEFVIDEGVAGKERRGAVTARGIEITPGSHTIKVYKRGYLPYTDVFRVRAGKTAEVEATLTLYFGWVTIISSPPGAAVLVDGSKRGATPVTVELPKGKHTIVLSHKGFMSTQRGITVAPGKSKELSINLNPVPKAPAVKKRKWYKKAWVWTVIGVAVAGGVTTAAVLLTRGGNNGPPHPNAEKSLSW